MRTALILWSRLSLSSFKTLRSFSITWPILCESSFSFFSFFFFALFLLPSFCLKYTLKYQFLFYFWLVGLCLRKNCCPKWATLILHFCSEPKVVDFKQIDAHIHQFKGSSARYIFHLVFFIKKINK